MSDEIKSLPTLTEKSKPFGAALPAAEVANVKPKEVSLDDLANNLAGIIKTLKPKVRDNTVRLAKSVHTLEFGLQYLRDHIKNLAK